MILDSSAQTCLLTLPKVTEDKLDAIFERFNLGSYDTTRKYGATGLGLTISKNLVELQRDAIV